MKILLLYMSLNDTTRRISRELKTVFESHNHRVIERDVTAIDSRASTYNDEDIDLIGIGSPVYELRIIEPLYGYLHKWLPQVKRRNERLKAFVYLTYGGITTGRAFWSVAKLLKKVQIPLIGGFKVKAPHFWCISNYPDEMARSTMQAFYEELLSKDFKAMEYEQIKAVFSRQKQLIKLLYPISGLLGKLRAQKVIIDTVECSQCGRCVRACPVGALRLAEDLTRDRHRCIHCYHCTMVCPRGAITMDIAKLERVVEKNKKIVGVEVPSNDVYV